MFASSHEKLTIDSVNMFHPFRSSDQSSAYIILHLNSNPIPALWHPMAERTRPRLQELRAVGGTQAFQQHLKEER